MANKSYLFFPLQLVHNDLLELYVKEDSEALWCGLSRKECENNLLVFSNNGEMLTSSP